MKKALASMVVFVFAGLLCTSLVTIFTASPTEHPYYNTQMTPYYL
jgi:hypothetical protein